MTLTDPDWIDPIESTFDPGKAVRSDQGVMLAGNPIAIALGKPGAPRNVAASINNWHARVALDTTTTPVVITGLDPNTIIQAMGSFANGALDDAELQMSGSANGGSTWGSWFDITQNPGQQNTRYGANVVINLTNGIFTSLSTGHGDLGAGPFNAIRFRHSSSMSGAGNDPGRIAVWAIGRAP